MRPRTYIITGTVLIMIATARRGLKLPSIYLRRPRPKERDDDLTQEMSAGVREHGKTGDWLVSRSYTLLADIFDLAQTKVSSSHAAVYDASSDTVIEATPPFVREVPLVEFIERNHSVSVIRPDGMTAEEKLEAVERSRSHVGAKFDWLATTGLYDSPDKWYCSELIFSAYGLAHEKRIVAPSDLLDYGHVVYQMERS